MWLYKVTVSATWRQDAAQNGNRTHPPFRVCHRSSQQTYGNWKGAKPGNWKGNNLAYKMHGIIKLGTF